MMPERSDSCTKRSTFTEKLARAESHILEFTCYRPKFTLLSNPTFSWYEHKLGIKKKKEALVFLEIYPTGQYSVTSFEKIVTKKKKKQCWRSEVELLHTCSIALDSIDDPVRIADRFFTSWATREAHSTVYFGEFS